MTGTVGSSKQNLNAGPLLWDPTTPISQPRVSAAILRGCARLISAMPFMTQFEMPFGTILLRTIAKLRELAP